MKIAFKKAYSIPDNLPLKINYTALFMSQISCGAGVNEYLYIWNLFDLKFSNSNSGVQPQKGELLNSKVAHGMK